MAEFIFTYGHFFNDEDSQHKQIDPSSLLIKLPHILSRFFVFDIFTNFVNWLFALFIIS